MKVNYTTTYNQLHQETGGTSIKRSYRLFHLKSTHEYNRQRKLWVCVLTTVFKVSNVTRSSGIEYVWVRTSMGEGFNILLFTGTEVNHTFAGPGTKLLPSGRWDSRSDLYILNANSLRALILMDYLGLAINYLTTTQIYTRLQRPT